MNAIIEKINRALEEAAAKAAAASAADAVEQIRIDYLGRNGLFPALSKEMGSVAPEERKETGRAFNEGRNRIQAIIEEAAARLASAPGAAEGALDHSLPGRRWNCRGYLPQLRRAQYADGSPVTRSAGYVLL